MHVVVIGAGVNGVGSALAIQQELPEVKVTIVASAFSPDTTGDGAAGLWGPHLVGGDPQQIARWSRRTHDLFHQLWREGDCPGIGLFSGSDASPEPTAHDTVPFFCGELSSDKHPQVALQSQMTSPSQVAPQSGGKPNAKSQSQVGPQTLVAPPSPVERHCQYVTFYAEPAKLLPFLLARFRERGGATVTTTVTALAELAAYDVIVNCSGLGARELVGDLGVYPIRGQVVRVRAPAVKTFLGTDTHYVIPNDDVVILGGTAQTDDWRRAPDAADTARILAGCCRLVPALRDAPVLRVWAGLRPYRAGGVRLELERRALAGRSVPVVHNYGHGGAGVTLFWGCALDVAVLVAAEVRRLGRSRL
ncbi:D-amino-acid oxidase-like [Pollicipes pollicipes]|uniref:D-amino-acid oxidase-like n=1 Tax=Pollicipes pollicipes TaxID=41117 RepID=UPI0018859AF9|nr:D-amino-acid oxidase-like [Pollicipes pollicipes]